MKNVNIYIGDRKLDTSFNKVLNIAIHQHSKSIIKTNISQNDINTNMHNVKKWLNVF